MMTLPAHDGFAYTVSPLSHTQKHRQHSTTTSPRPSTNRTTLQKLQRRLSSPPPAEAMSSAKLIQRGTPRMSSPGSDICDGPNSPTKSFDKGKSPNNEYSSDRLTNGHATTNGVVNQSVEQPRKIDWEIPRKILHSSIGFVVIPLYTSHTSPQIVVSTLSSALAVIVTADVIRLRSARFERLYEKFLGFLMRDVEKHQTNGVVWYILGCIFVLSTYQLDVAVVSILILSWCDTTASFFGRMYGARTPPLPRSLPIPFTKRSISLPFAKRKSLAGFIAAAVTGCLIGVSFWGWIAPLGATTPSWTWQSEHGWMNCARLAMVGIASGLVAGVAESLDVGSLDDNLTLPVIAGGFLSQVLRR